MVVALAFDLLDAELGDTVKVLFSDIGAGVYAGWSQVILLGVDIEGEAGWYQWNDNGAFIRRDRRQRKVEVLVEGPFDKREGH